MYLSSQNVYKKGGTAINMVISVGRQFVGHELTASTALAFVSLHEMVCSKYSFY